MAALTFEGKTCARPEYILGLSYRIKDLEDTDEQNLSNLFFQIECVKPLAQGMPPGEKAYGLTITNAELLQYLAQLQLVVNNILAKRNQTIIDDEVMNIDSAAIIDSNRELLGLPQVTPPIINSGTNNKSNVENNQAGFLSGINPWYLVGGIGAIMIGVLIYMKIKK